MWNHRCQILLICYLGSIELFALLLSLTHLRCNCHRHCFCFYFTSRFTTYCIIFLEIYIEQSKNCAPEGLEEWMRPLQMHEHDKACFYPIPLLYLYKFWTFQIYKLWIIAKILVFNERQWTIRKYVVHGAWRIHSFLQMNTVIFVCHVCARFTVDSFPSKRCSWIYWINIKIY